MNVHIHVSHLDVNQERFFFLNEHLVMVSVNYPILCHLRIGLLEMMGDCLIIEHWDHVTIPAKLGFIEDWFHIWYFGTYKIFIVSCYIIPWHPNDVSWMSKNTFDSFFIVYQLRTLVLSMQYTLFCIKIVWLWVNQNINSNVKTRCIMDGFLTKLVANLLKLEEID